MYPGMMGWWKRGHAHGACHTGGAEARCGSPGECGHGEGARGFRWGHGGPPEAFAAGDHDGHFGGFGVRRPLRFLAYKLELDEAQVEALASILNDLKTERAQGEVDLRRSTAGIAEAIAAETLDVAKITAVTQGRVKSAERLRDAVVEAIGRIHAMLTPEQRTRFAYLIRTGALSI